MMVSSSRFEWPCCLSSSDNLNRGNSEPASFKRSFRAGVAEHQTDQMVMEITLEDGGKLVVVLLEYLNPAPS